MSFSRRLPASALAAASALVLTGCVTVDVPNDPAATTRAATFSVAMDYLIAARAQLLSKAQNREHFNDATKAGVGVGVGGAGVGAVFRSAVNPLLGFLTFGAVSYALNRDVNPMALDGVYRAGVSNIDCIRSSAVLANQTVEENRPAILLVQPKLNAAIDKVVKDILAANGDPTYTLDVDQALKDVKTAEAVSGQINAYLATTEVGEQIVSGVDATLSAVNTQARARDPSIDTVLQSGSTFSSAMDTGLQFDTKLQTARSQLQAKPQANGAEAIDFAQDRAVLKALVELIPDLALGPQLAAIGQCHAQFSVLQPVTVSPSPVVLSAGATSALKVTGNAPYYVQWDTPQPQNVHVDSGLQVSMTAESGTPAATAVFHVVDRLGTPSDAVTLNVTPSSTEGHAQQQAQGAAPGPPPAPAGR